MLKYVFKLNTNILKDSYINIPIDQLFYPTPSQYSDIENKFDITAENIINPTIDYEKVKIRPIYFGESINEVSLLKFNLKFYINNNWTTGTTSLSEVGFDIDDVINRRQQLEKTFLRLSFYDSDDLKTQNLLYYSTIFIDSGKLYGDYISGTNINDLKMEFSVNNPLFSKEIKSFEGFYIYLFGDDIPKNQTKTIYMKIEYNSALNGKTSLFLRNRSIDSNGFNLNDLKTHMFIPITVEYNANLNKYVYWIDSYFSQVVEIDLYQAKVI